MEDCCTARTHAPTHPACKKRLQTELAALFFGKAGFIEYYYFYSKLSTWDMRNAHKNLEIMEKSLCRLFLGIVGDAVGDFLLCSFRAFPA